MKRGLKRRVSLPVRALAIDETSFQKRHEYVTVLFDREKDFCDRYNRWTKERNTAKVAER